VKAFKLTILLASGALFAGCAYAPLGQSPSQPTVANSGIGGPLEATAYVYGGRRVGRRYRLSRIVDNFTVSVNGNLLTFAAAIPAVPVAAAPARPVPATPIPTVAPTEPAQGVALASLEEAKKQIDDIRQSIESNRVNPKSSSADFQAINSRLDEIEALVLTAAGAIVRVGFPSNSTTFTPDRATAKALIESGNAARRINVSGHTDAFVAGPADSKIALGRALAARDFMVKNGVEGKKISVFSKAAGAFAVANNSVEGRATNRRVEIEFVDARVADLVGDSAKLALN
jgi:outer membrane protein OmpA-like peptidoglycan-associated protein